MAYDHLLNLAEGEDDVIGGVALGDLEEKFVGRETADAGADVFAAGALAAGGDPGDVAGGSGAAFDPHPRIAAKRYVIMMIRSPMTSPPGDSASGPNEL